MLSLIGAAILVGAPYLGLLLITRKWVLLAVARIDSLIPR